MLETHEIATVMAFLPGYVVLGTKRERVRQLGNAVTSPVAEILIAALVDAATGEPVERAAWHPVRPRTWATPAPLPVRPDGAPARQ